MTRNEAFESLREHVFYRSVIRQLPASAHVFMVATLVSTQSLSSDEFLQTIRSMQYNKTNNGGWSIKTWASMDELFSVANQMAGECK